MQKKSMQETIEALQLDINLNRASTSALVELAQSARRQHFERGEYVFTAGDASTDFYLVASGRVILAKEAPSGKIFTSLVAVRGTPLNAVTCFQSRPRFFSARVVERTVVLAIPSPTFRRWVLSNPEVAEGIMSTMGDLLDAAYTRILDLVDARAETRILNVLGMLSSRMGLSLPLTNNDVAEMVGVSRETAARVISRLQEIGLIFKVRGTLQIIDKPRLDELSSGAFFML
ncbi:Crp/Fnr family transcriptional regulator [Desulfoplanes formicivorans]|uniref:Crp/Fnr family transcriptional regulator n=1 Tax=Desulfoplanes formicivorans TaxID=1592317 RepID=A0A194AML1_9BACT|nr:Crp/Fnr family transcriptional regulator [Desulfoplanes formicivorans]GAU09864.1 hypothetical protein DPF_2600 [Desulfoplanes formicivorans]